MKAIHVNHKTNPPTLAWADTDAPSFSETDVLVSVKASAVNRADLMQAQGNYPPPAGASPILGLEMAGIITEIGSNVADWQIGDRVCALLSGGGYAEQVVVPHQMLIKIPDDKSFEWAAAIPEVWLTAYVNLFKEGRLQPDETVLIHAGASGVGTAAIQLAKAHGAKVVITAGSQEKLDVCTKLGADLAINRHTQDFYDVIKTNGLTPDLILCPVAANYLERNIKLLNRFGRLVHISLLSGRTATLDLGLVMGKRLTLIGSTLRSRPLEEKIALTEQFTTQFWRNLCDGTLNPIIDTTFPIQEAQAAHAHIRANKNIGKVILSLE